MNNNPSQGETATASKSRNSRFIPFFLIIMVAVAIGFGIRYFSNKPQAPSEGGTWEVYFSKVGVPNNSISLENRLVTKLNTASNRIDAAIQQLNSKPVADALINAHKNGVSIRIFTENIYADEKEIARLEQSGIPVRDDGDNDGLMHHKFIVVDGRYVWTGSYNTTYNGAFKNNNNVIWIDSAPLAMNYTQEFRELFISAEFDRSADPNVPFPRITLIDGTEITTYFAPENDTITPLLKEITSAKTSIHFMAYSFTHDKLGQAMRDRFKSGISVAGVFDLSQKAVDRKYSEFDQMKEEGLSVRLDKETGKMHHKVIVIDEETVITGSYNFSRSAEIRNSENLLIIKGNKDIARAYIDEFNSLK